MEISWFQLESLLTLYKQSWAVIMGKKATKLYWAYQEDFATQFYESKECKEE
jgi:hypothetical protein